MQQRQNLCIKGKKALFFYAIILLAMQKAGLFEESFHLANQMLFVDNQIITLEAYAPLYDLILYKFLVLSETLKHFEKDQQFFFEKLKYFQLNRKHQFFCNVYIFIMRQMLNAGSYKELNLFTQNWEFQE